jgi:small basic protein
MINIILINVHKRKILISLFFFNIILFNVECIIYVYVKYMYIDYIKIILTLGDKFFTLLLIIIII